MVSKIAMILELLIDGKWHSTEELRIELELNEQKLQEITAFLNKYTFVKIDGKNGKIRISKDLQKLMAKTVETINC